jgi:hypothetical protein
VVAGCKEMRRVSAEAPQLPVRFAPNSPTPAGVHRAGWYLTNCMVTVWIVPPLPRRVTGGKATDRKLRRQALRA